jgi:hypothetical protein
LRKSLFIIAFLVLVPCVKADPVVFQATSGYFGALGQPGGFVLFGDGWTATLNVNLFSCTSPTTVILGCSNVVYAVGFATVVLNGVTLPSVVLDTTASFSQAPIIPSGVLPATFSTPASVGIGGGCFGSFNDQCRPSNDVNFIIPPGTFTATVAPDGSGGFSVISEFYTFGTFSTPEPSTVGFLLVGISFVLVMARKRIGQGSQKTA